MAKTQKQRTWDACSRYTRLKDALEFCKKRKIDISQFNDYRDLPVHCCSCGTIRTFRTSDAGHCFGRGSGGWSGTYFDERNLSVQCKTCNVFHQGNFAGFKRFLIDRFGEGIIEELEIKHKTNSYTQIEIAGLEIFFQDEFERMLKENGFI